MARGDIREQLIDVGVKSFLRGGFNATGVKDVADKAGVPKGSFYYYFESKVAFGEAVVDAYAEEAAEARAALLNQAVGPPLARLRRSFEAYLPVFKASGHTGGCLLGNLSLEAADHSEPVRARLRAAFNSWQAALRDVLAEAEEAGDLPTGLRADEAAAFLVNAWEGALVRMKAERSAAPLNLFLDIVFDRLFAKPSASRPKGVRRRPATGVGNTRERP